MRVHDDLGIDAFFISIAEQYACLFVNTPCEFMPKAAANRFSNAEAFLGC